MTKFNYPRSRATADRLIDKFGQPGTLTRYGKSGDEWNPTRTPENAAVTVAVMEFQESEIDGTVIRTGDKRVYIAAGGIAFTPETGHTLTIADDPWELVNVRRLSPAGVDVYYEAQARA